MTASVFSEQLEDKMLLTATAFGDHDHDHEHPHDHAHDAHCHHGEEADGHNEDCQCDVCQGAALASANANAAIDLEGDSVVDAVSSHDHDHGEEHGGHCEDCQCDACQGAAFASAAPVSANVASEDELQHHHHHHHHSFELREEYSSVGTTVLNASDQGEFLSEPAEGAPLAVAFDFLADNAAAFGLEVSDLQQFEITDHYESVHTGVTHIYLQQQLNGLPVANADLNINVMPDGRIINAGSSFVAKANQDSSLPVEPELTEAEALESLAHYFEWSFSESPEVTGTGTGYGPGPATLLSAPELSREAIPVELQYVTTEDGVELAWRVNVQAISGLQWLDASVNAIDGTVEYIVDWVSHASYNVFEAPKENPYDGDRSISTNPHDPVASPFGWHDTDGVAGAEFTITRGNNVNAYTDVNDDNAVDANSQPDGGPGLDFDNSLDLSQEPAAYADAAVTNLFYWNNVVHDVHFHYGFDEAAGNFQETNYSGQGAGGDPVHAQAQDGADVGRRNNANMGTPPDGSSPRMQMYLWNRSNPERDGDLDAGIIAHEYGHGVSNRLTGGPANSGALGGIQSGGMGEGWSDLHGLFLTQQLHDQANDARGIGAYALNQAPDAGGIRSQRYSYSFDINNHTYNDVRTASGVHAAGETWATTLWDLNWALIDGELLDPAIPTAGLGFDPDFYNGTGGNNLAMQLMMDGMKLQPVRPTFLDARDAILAADLALTGGQYQRTIWTVFARRGMGWSADDGGSSSTRSVTEAFDLPPLNAGLVTFDEVQYEMGDSVGIHLTDIDLGGNPSADVRLESSTGDVEVITLTATMAFGDFEATVASDQASANSGDGIIQVTNNATITVTYLDADDGTGNPGSSTDEATFLLYNTILDADFSDDNDGSPFDEGFTATASPANEWHLSVGRGNDAGHTADDSFYFGTGETATTSGSHQNNADGTLVSPVIDLTQMDYARVSFNHFASIQRDNDFGIVNVITPTETIRAGISGAHFSTSTAGFENAVLDLTRFVGQPIQLEFHFTSDESNTNEGWYIDDVIVSGGTFLRAGIVVTETDGDTVVSEDGLLTDTFDVALTQQPTNDVFVTIGSSDPTEVTADQTTLHFTPLNWSEPQTVTVRGVDDVRVDGTAVTSLIVGIDDNQSAAEYRLVPDSGVPVFVVDDDVPGMSITETDGSTDLVEGGATDDVYIVLLSAPISDSVFRITSLHAEEVAVDTPTITFNESNWNTPQQVLFSAVDDDIRDGSTATAIRITVDPTSNPAFTVLPQEVILAFTEDNEVSGFSLTESDSGTTVTEGGDSDTIDLVLPAVPLTDVVVDIEISHPGELYVSNPAVTFTPENWNVPQPISVFAFDDPGVDGDQDATLTFGINEDRSDHLFKDIPVQAVDVTVVDNDVPFLDVDRSGDAVAATDGILALRYMLGFRGDALIDGAVSNFAGNNSAKGIETSLANSTEMLDADGDGATNASTDGVLIMRFLLGFTGETLTRNAIGAGATRTTGAKVAEFLSRYLPLDGSGGGTTQSSNNVGSSPSKASLFSSSISIEDQSVMGNQNSNPESAKNESAVGSFDSDNRGWLGILNPSDASGSNSSVQQTALAGFDEPAFDLETLTTDLQVLPNREHSKAEKAESSTAGRSTSFVETQIHKAPDLTIGDVDEVMKELAVVGELASS